MKKIYVSFSPAYIPLVKKLHADMPDAKIYAGHPEFARMLNDIDIPAVVLGADLAADVRPVSYTHAARIITQMTVTRVNSVDGVHPAVTEYMNRNVPSFLYPRIDGLITYALALEATHPDLCIVHNDVEPVLSVVAQWARSANVPCLHVPHAVYIDDFDRGEPGTDVHDYVLASHIAVAGPYQERWYKTRGGNTIVTGLPQFDKWASFRMDRKQAKGLFGLDRERKLLTFGSSWRQDTNLLGCHDGLEEAYVEVLKAMQALPDIQLIISMHPHANNAAWHAKLAQDMGVTANLISAHGDIALAASDVLMTYGPSNWLLEGACIPGLRLLSLGGFAGDAEVDTVEAGAEAIQAAIVDALAKPPRDTRGFVQKYMGNVDGRATDRIAALAEELCQSGS